MCWYVSYREHALFSLFLLKFSLNCVDFLCVTFCGCVWSFCTYVPTMLWYRCLYLYMNMWVCVCMYWIECLYGCVWVWVCWIECFYGCVWVCVRVCVCVCWIECLCVLSLFLNILLVCALINVGFFDQNTKMLAIPRVSEPTFTGRQITLRSLEQRRLKILPGKAKQTKFNNFFQFKIWNESVKE